MSSTSRGSARDGGPGLGPFPSLGPLPSGGFGAEDMVEDALGPASRLGGDQPRLANGSPPLLANGRPTKRVSPVAQPQGIIRASPKGLIGKFVNSINGNYVLKNVSKLDLEVRF